MNNDTALQMYGDKCVDNYEDYVIKLAIRLELMNYLVIMGTEFLDTEAESIQQMVRFLLLFLLLLLLLLLLLIMTRPDTQTGDPGRAPSGKSGPTHRRGVHTCPLRDLDYVGRQCVGGHLQRHHGRGHGGASAQFSRQGPQTTRVR